MSKVIEKIKDLFYNTTDYLIILLIVILVSGVIVWRLDLLFERNNKVPKDDNIVATDVKKADGSKQNTKVSDDLIEKEKRKQKGTIIVDIPEGALPDVIANILLENKVITDKFEFLKKSQEMGLDTSFKSGEYEFEKDESVEDVIRKVTKQ